jgi:hypothetical protein
LEIPIEKFQIPKLRQGEADFGIFISRQLPCHLKSVISNPSSVISNLSSSIRHPSSAVGHLKPVIRHLPFVIRHLKPVIFNPAFSLPLYLHD